MIYSDRDQAEHVFSELKYFCRLAARYYKLADCFLAMVKLVSMRLWLPTYQIRPSRVRRTSSLNRGANLPHCRVKGHENSRLFKREGRLSKLKSISETNVIVSATNAHRGSSWVF